MLVVTVRRLPARNRLPGQRLRRARSILHILPDNLTGSSGFEQAAGRATDGRQRVADMNIPSRGARGARGMPNTGPSKDRGRREGRMLTAPAVRVQQKAPGRTTGSAEQPAFPARWAYVLYVLSLVRRAFWPPSPARRASVIANLASASGCQNHTTSTSAKASHQHHTRTCYGPPQSWARPVDIARRDDIVAATASHPACRDDRDTPLVSRRDGSIKPLIWGRSQEYFCKTELAYCDRSARRANSASSPDESR
jgi:hypothetical protein